MCSKSYVVEYDSDPEREIDPILLAEVRQLIASATGNAPEPCTPLDTSRVAKDVDRWCAVTNTQGLWNPADPPISLALLRFAGEDPAQVTALIKAWCPSSGSVRMIEGVDVLIAPNWRTCQVCGSLLDFSAPTCPVCHAIYCPF